MIKNKKQTEKMKKQKMGMKNKTQNKQTLKIKFWHSQSPPAHERQERSHKLVPKFNFLFTTIFLAVLMLSFVSAETNTSIMYGENDSGAQVPIAVDDSGRLKMNLNMLNVTAGDIIASGNLTLGEKITFALGGVIDNMVDGWIRITDGLNMSSGNISLGGKLLSNEGGTLTWGGLDVRNNVSIMYAENESGSANPLQIDSGGALQIDVVSMATDMWEKVGGVVRLVSSSDVNISGNLNVSGMIIGEANGVGISSDVEKDADYVLTSADKNRLVILNSSASADTTFTLPSASNGEIYRILNDAEYVLTINVSSATDSIWNSGSGYGIDLPDKGTMVELRYSASRNKWDILQKTGGKVLIEGLVLMEPMNQISLAQNTQNTVGRGRDLTDRHHIGVYGQIIERQTSYTKFPPTCWEFDGTGDYSDTEDSADWDIFGDQTGHKTVAFWVYHDGAGALEYYLSHFEDSSNRFIFMKGVDNTLISYFNSDVATDYQIGGGSISATTWTHIALVINGSDVGLYVNGTQVAYNGSWTPDTFSGNLYVGQRGDNAYYLDGRMQDLHISYNNPYNADPQSDSSDSFTVPAAPFRGVMQISLSLIKSIAIIK